MFMCFTTNNTHMYIKEIEMQTSTSQIMKCQFTKKKNIKNNKEDKRILLTGKTGKTMKTRTQNLHSETTVFQRGSVTCQLTAQTYIHTLLGLQMILFNRAQGNTTSTSCKELYYGSKSEPSTIEFNNNSMRKEVICFWCRKRDDFLDNNSEYRAMCTLTKHTHPQRA